MHVIFTALFLSLTILSLSPLADNQAYASVSNGKVFQWSNSIDTPQTIYGLSEIIAVDTGMYHSIALKADGTVWSWGNNQYGQLGNGTTQNSYTPVQVLGLDGIGKLEGIIAIAAGERYSLALKKDGTVWVWGSNPSGYRGTGDLLNQNLLYPQRVNGGNLFTNIIKISAGGNHSLALSSDGTLWAWGINGQGQIGIGCAGTIFCPNTRFPRTILSNIKEISAGNLHSIAVDSDRNVWGWGRSFEGQLGKTFQTLSDQYSPSQIPNLNQIEKVNSKDYSNVALKNDGTIFAWGGFQNLNTNNYNPTEITNLSNIRTIVIGTDTAISSIIALGAKADGTVWQWMAKNGSINQIEGLENISSIVVRGSSQNSHLALEKYDPTPPTPTPPVPFLNLPVNNVALGKTFDEIALNPNSWFDHKYPHPYIPCCIQKVLNYTGTEIDDYYRSHNGYDYGIKHGLGLKKPVLAAASGTATYLPNNGDLGNMIKIDHNNGYQTWYAHLDSSTLDFENNENVEVIAGQEIGKVGKTGNSPHAHLHFTVFKDSNEDGSFNNDYPFGLVDPLGWLGTSTDPWEEYESNGRKGSKSYNLFIDHNYKTEQTVPDAGGIVNYQNLTVSIPSGGANSSLTIKIKKGPFEKKSNIEKSIAPSFFIEAYNALNQNVKDFNEPVTLSYDYSDSDLSNIDEQTLTYYYFDEVTKTWVELPSTINSNKTVVTITPHFSQFAVMGELIDTTPPETSLIKEGTGGQANWFGSNVKITLVGEDNVGGLGVFDTIYSLDGQEWDIYTNPLEINTEGEHKISYMSYDNAGNEEGIKTYTFNIDKTPPATTLQTDVSYIWPPDGRNVPATIDGSIDEENLFLKTLVITDEYNEFSQQTIDFGQTVNLKASRKGNDFDGRQYTVKLTAIDMAGNITEKKEVITVLHDQGI